LPGGFLGVEVFFVVSGFLITSLLIEERESTRRIDLKQFWIRRARRLLPALVVMLAATAVCVAFYATDSAPDFRRDVLPSLGYFSNWWQIFAVDTPYFAASSLPVLRHLWSLAVEEQWYLIWPYLAQSGCAQRSRVRFCFYAVAQSCLRPHFVLCKMMKLVPTFYTSAPSLVRAVFCLAQRSQCCGDHGVKILYRVGGNRRLLTLLQSHRSQ
jgi:peptidoglycan/LPS O-acetylase OafA/YrhL